MRVKGKVVKAWDIIDGKMVELKPCPFCGGKATLLEAKDDNDIDTVCCRNSFCELWDTFTIKKWNTRYNP